ncbi:hypothetical protein ElyMa_000335000 [Elysia marginata]|uniref:Uncharacterized protein n=1 Tax=Elysia marginata TaxID=1093978 RepID=A0AAV4FCC9_9GAST|nr:hypothetical protein ElyMa_000335000 [Elysia marginata]
MFTKSRVVIILCVLFCVNLALSVPVPTVYRLTWVENPKTNVTYRSITFTYNIREIFKINDILNRNIITWVAYITVVTCVVILASKLQAASRFRRS